MRSGGTVRSLAASSSGVMSQLGVDVKKSGKYPSAPMTSASRSNASRGTRSRTLAQPSPLQRMLGRTLQHPHRMTQLVTGRHPEPDRRDVVGREPEVDEVSIHIETLTPADVPAGVCLQAPIPTTPTNRHGTRYSP